MGNGGSFAGPFVRSYQLRMRGAKGVVGASSECPFWVGAGQVGGQEPLAGCSICPIDSFLSL